MFLCVHRRRANELSSMKTFAGAIANARYLCDEVLVLICVQVHKYHFKRVAAVAELSLRILCTTPCLIQASTS